MKERSMSRQTFVASIALTTCVLASSAAMSQMGQGPKTEKTFGIGLPRDHASHLFTDKDYPVFPLTPAETPW